MHIIHDDLSLKYLRGTWTGSRQPSQALFSDFAR